MMIIAQWYIQEQQAILLRSVNQLLNRQYDPNWRDVYQEELLICNRCICVKTITARALVENYLKVQGEGMNESVLKFIFIMKPSTFTMAISN